MKKTVSVLIFISVGSMIFLGCASSRTTRTVTVVTTSTSEAQGNRGNFTRGASDPEYLERTKVAKETTKIEEKREPGSRGVIGSTFHFIGQVLAFPFKVIAGIIEFIF